MKNNLNKKLKTTNRRQIGELVIRKRGNGEERVFRKIDQNKWVENSRYVWEQYNGKIPKGMCVIHINGDRYDDRIENLAVLTRPTFNYIIARKLYFDDCEAFKVACMMAMIAHIKPHYIRPSKRKGDVNARKKLFI